MLFWTLYISKYLIGCVENCFKVASLSFAKSASCSNFIISSWYYWLNELFYLVIQVLCYLNLWSNGSPIGTEMIPSSKWNILPFCWGNKLILTVFMVIRYLEIRNLLCAIFSNFIFFFISSWSCSERIRLAKASNVILDTPPRKTPFCLLFEYLLLQCS